MPISPVKIFHKRVICNFSEYNIVVFSPPGDGDDDDPDQDHEEPQLLVRLLQGGEKALQASEMAHKLTE